jgi:hypothetical protein
MPHLLLRVQVPVGEFMANLVEICSSLREMLPSAKLILATPPPINNQVWPAATSNKGYGGGRSLERYARRVHDSLCSTAQVPASACARPALGRMPAPKIAGLTRQRAHACTQNSNSHSAPCAVLPQTEAIR